jgi:hypothetical protein
MVRELIPNEGRPFSPETAVEEGFRARKWPSHPGKEALWDEF